MAEQQKKQTQEKRGAEGVMPYSPGEGKGKQVETMFNSIAPAYDFMNSCMSLGMHTHWRNRALREGVRRLGHTPEDVLDVATGTGDLIFAMRRRYPHASLTGIDLSGGMLEIARKKLAEFPEERNITFIQGDCMEMPLEDESFDMVTVAYGVRNFENMVRGYREMLRVLRPGGIVCVVELSQPTSALPLLMYKGYTRGFIPVAGRLMSGDPRAYSYLHESIEAAPQRGAMTALMEEAGFSDCTWKSIFPGAVCIYIGTKQTPEKQ